MLRFVCPSVSHFIMKHPNHPRIVQILVSTCLPWCCTENSTNAPCTGAPSGSGTCQKSLRPEFSNTLQFWATKTTNGATSRLQNMALCKSGERCLLFCNTGAAEYRSRHLVTSFTSYLAATCMVPCFFAPSLKVGANVPFNWGRVLGSVTLPSVHWPFWNTCCTV